MQYGKHMRAFAKSIALFILALIEISFDFFTSPLPPISERLKMIFGRYELGTTRFVKKNLYGGVAFDIGANVGYYARLMARRAEHVYAFEPDPDNFKILQKNCKRHPNITPLNMAVSDHVGTVDFFKVKNSAMRHSLIDEGNTEKISVAATSIDAFIAEHDIHNVVMLKIDTEGAEPLVFKGMQQLLAAEKPIIIYEGFDPDKKAIDARGELVQAADVPRIGSKQKVVNLVW